MQLPPPIHGQSVMNQTIYESNLINESFNFKTIPLHFAALENIGKPSVNKLWKMICYLFIIFKELIIFRPALIYFTLSPTGFAFYRDSIYVALIKLFGAPIVFHLHGKGIKEKAKNPFNRILYTFVFYNSKIILLSKLLRPDLDLVIDKNAKLFYLPNGIKYREKSHNLRQLQIPPTGAPVILFLSNIVRTKGVFVLLEALSHLKKRRVQFKAFLVGGIVGAVPEKLLHKAINNYGLINDVKYLGPKYGKEKEEIMINSDIFVFPTYQEAFPLVLLEAMRAGVAVISTYEGAIPEIIENGSNGYLVQQKDAIQLADRIEALIKDETLRLKFGRNSLEKFKSSYTSGIFESNLTQILKTICNYYNI